MRVIREIVRDTLAIAHIFHGKQVGPREIATTALHDGVQVLALSRVRQAACRWRLSVVDSVVRRAQKALFGVDIESDVTLGEGVVFVHTVGVVIGGNAHIGDRVMFLGSNTVGSLKRNEYPRVGNDVIVGAGARILGAITIGDGATIGANAVVLRNVPAAATASGVPAAVRERSPDGAAATRSNNET